jgi:hypothetical protein
MHSLRAFSSQSAGELDILGLDGDTLGVDGSQVGIFKETDKVSFSGFLESTNGRGLETEVGLEVLGDFTDQALEGQLADKEFGRLLVTTNFTESNGSGSVSVGLLDSSGNGGRLAGSLGGELLAGGLASSGLSSGLLGTGHL